MIMNNLKYIHEQFEKEKNMKALGLTAFVTGALFLLFFLVSWTVPVPLPPAIDEGIEVNLGNSETGFGNVPPQIPGELSAATETSINAPQTTHAAAETQPEVADNNEPDAPIVHTSTKPATKKNPVSTENNDTKKNNDKPVISTVPKPAKPKAVYAGGKSSSGGNNADSYNKVRDQGVAGGKGDQGKPNGNPNSDSYTGNGGTGTSGVKITNGLSGRRPVSNTRFQDTYNHGSVVEVNVTIDENGNVISKSLKKPSPFSDINKIALKRAGEIKFSKGSEVQSGTIQIRFEEPKG